jgi:hypothetical protein
MQLLRLLTAILLLAAASGGCSQVQTTASTPDTQTAGGSGGGGGSATLTWDAPTTNTNGSPLSDLAGYYVYVGSSPDTLTQLTTLADAQAITYVIDGLASGTWYFAVQAYDSSGNRSALSNIESKTF